MPPPPPSSYDEFAELARSFIKSKVPGEQPLDLTITFASGRTMMLPIPTDPPPRQDARPSCSHSPDFRSVRWFGVEYTFTPTQAACVKALWEAWEDGTPDVGQAAILEAADSTADRLRDVFRDSPAWGELIVPGGKGTFRLAEPG